MMTKEELQDLQPGDWLLIKYGFDRLPFYVIKNLKQKEMILAGYPRWLVSCSTFFTYHSLSNQEMNGDVIKIGHTEARWWWKYLPWSMRDLYCPFKPLGRIKKTNPLQELLNRFEED